MELYTLKINVNKQRLSFGENPPEIFSGDQSIDFVEFTFTDDTWNFPDIWAIFSRQKGAAYQIALDDNKVMIPAEVMQKRGYVYIGLMATDGDNVQTSSVLQYSIRQGAANVETVTPSPSIYEQFLVDLEAYQEAIHNLETLSATAETLPAGSDATALYDNGVLELGIPKGDTGATGNGISSITETSVSGAVHTYTITYTNGQTTTFEVTDGEVTQAVLDNFKDEVVLEIESKNKFDGVYSPGFVNQVNGNWESGGTTYSGTANMVYVGESPFTLSLRPLTSSVSIACRYALYDETGTFIRGAIINNTDWTYITDADFPTQTMGYLTFTDSNARYIRFSFLDSMKTRIRAQVEKGSTPTNFNFYFKDYSIVNPALDLNGDLTKTSLVGTEQLKASTAALTDGVSLEIDCNLSVRKNKTYHLFANIDNAFNALYFGHGETDYSYYFKLDGTNIAFMSNGSTGTTLAHGLTLSTYVDIILDVKAEGTGTLIINTLSGSYTRTVSVLNGYKGKVFVRPDGCTLSNVSLHFTSADFRQPLWFFGNSYFSHTSDNRWPYYLIHWGFDRCLLNGFPGMNSTEALEEFNSYLQNNAGLPSYAVWCLGMNDPDTGGTANATWLNCVEEFIITCRNKGITPILATIPNVPSYTHYYKNEWVQASGYRYIDFAKAVGAEIVGSHWYPGCLSSDNTHPTEAGARLLCLQALKDVPELTLGSI